MKRLLAQFGCDIFQIAQVFRANEQGRRHLPEFSLLEWYRVGIDEQRLMREMAQFLSALMQAFDWPAPKVRYYRYRECFEQFLGVNPHQADTTQLRQFCQQHLPCDHLSDTAKPRNLSLRDRYLEYLFTSLIEPHLGGNLSRPELCFVYDYPASQAALARTDTHAGDAIARRFELFMAGMELANGYYELSDAKQQQQRFIHDNQIRQQMHKPALPMDSLLLDALTHGLPDCAGVALGIERLLMVLLKKTDISQVVSFVK